MLCGYVTYVVYVVQLITIFCYLHSSLEMVGGIISGELCVSKANIFLGSRTTVF